MLIGQDPGKKYGWANHTEATRRIEGQAERCQPATEKAGYVENEITNHELCGKV